MSLNSNMLPYELSIYNETEDALGTIIKAYTRVTDIDVSINYTTMQNIDNGIVYSITQPQGITEYKEFDKFGKYRLSSLTEIYDIESINIGGRYTQLILKEVSI